MTIILLCQNLNGALEYLLYIFHLPAKESNTYKEDASKRRIYLVTIKQEKKSKEKK